MESHIVKLITHISLIAVVAYIVASAVGKREQLLESATPKKQKARGDVWQTPIAGPARRNEQIMNW